MNNLREGRSWHDLVVPLAIVALTVIAYWQVGGYGFLSYDDNTYVTENPLVRGGLTVSGILRAFSSIQASNWHPLTWWSHMADVEWWGMNPGAHHLSNLLLHCLTSVLLFLFFRRSTGSLWRSAFVVSVFALHPMHVQSVAWISERKDVLSAFFLALVLLAYLGFHRCRTPGRYLAIVVLSALALMAKPMAVTLPFLLLLVDRWPLERTDGLARQIREKTPLFLLAAGVAVVTFAVQSSAGSVLTLPLGVRLANVVVAYASYVVKAFWPAGLAAFYPHPRTIDFMVLLWAATMLVTITIVCIRLRGRAPWFPVGWFWYLGALVPVIGIVQVGGQAMADRYTYLPFLGLSIIVAWGGGCLVSRWGRTVMTSLLAVSVLALAFRTHREVSYWADDLTLFTRALAVTQDNHVAHHQVGVAKAAAGDLPAALLHQQEAVRLRPEWATAQQNLGKFLVVLGRPGEAEEPFRHALSLEASAAAHVDLASALLAQRKLDPAIEQYQAALVMDPGFAEAHSNLAAAYLMQGDFSHAIEHFDRAVAVQPGRADLHFNRGIALQMAGRLDEAIVSFERTLVIDPAHQAAARRLDAARAAR